MNLYAKGKVLKQEGDIATIQLTNEELGRAVLNYVVNNTDSGIGERFMQNLFAGKPMSLNELLMSNVKESNKVSANQLNDDLKKNYRDEPVAYDSASKVNVNEKSLGLDKSKEINNEEKIAYLLKAKEVQIKVLAVKENCQNVYERVVRTKNGISTQIISNCDIIFTFAENNVTYSFVNYKNGVPNVITPNNNLVFIWNDATTEELEELISLI